MRAAAGTGCANVHVGSLRAGARSRQRDFDASAGTVQLGSSQTGASLQSLRLEASSSLQPPRQGLMLLPMRATSARRAFLPPMRACAAAAAV
jgi:hypothetical protein